ncbi:MAG TPA: hypothetical protein VHI78_13370, partial [Bacteroidales bacterium]|nr:hypothetical protein [Bacteroidales bacterium]
FPENKVLVGDVPYKLYLTVRAKGFSILRSKLNLDLVPLRFNVNTFSLNSKGVDTFFIVTETVKDVLSAELDEMTILDISPDTLFFKLSGISVKKIAVLPELSMHTKFFQQQFMLNGRIEVFPDSIIISGPGSVVDSIDKVFTEPIRYTNLSDTVTGDFAIQPIELVTYSQQKVTATIPVDRFTEVETRQTVVPINVPDSVDFIPIPGQVSITYRVCISNYDLIRNNPLTPRIDFNEVKSNIPWLNVFLLDTPGYINNLQFNPKVIEFLITRK